MNPLIVLALSGATLPALAASPLSAAQTAALPDPTEATRAAFRAADPDVSVPAPLSSAPRQGLSRAPDDSPALSPPAVADWKAVNAEVAAFPRGHADLVRWEAQAARSGSTPPALAPSPASPSGGRP